jgi:hypothetical protein
MLTTEPFESSLDTYLATIGDDEIAQAVRGAEVVLLPQDGHGPHEGPVFPAETRQLIEGVLREAYRGDLEIVRKAFVEKLEFFLRLIANALEEAGCTDNELDMNPEIRTTD